MTDFAPGDKVYCARDKRFTGIVLKRITPADSPVELVEVTPDAGGRERYFHPEDLRHAAS